MKIKSYLFILLIFFVLSCKNDNDEKIEIIPDPINSYKIDVKTSFSNKQNYSGIKESVINYFSQGVEWAQVVEFGEDYELWIEDVEREKINDVRWKINFKLIFKENPLFQKETIHISENMTCVFDMPKDFEDVISDGQKLKQFINNSIQLSKKVGMINPKIMATALAAEKLMKMFNFITSLIFDNDEELRKVRRLESVFFGQVIGERIKLGLVNYENNKEM